MWDLVRFSPNRGEGAPSPQFEGPSDPLPTYINALTAGANFFSSVNSVEQARSACKRAKYLHFPTYEADIGLVRTMKENECALLVAVSDFLDPNAAQVAQRLGRARQLIYLALHFGCAVRVVSLAREEMELRSEHELMAMGMLLGMTEVQMRAQIKEKLPQGGQMKTPAPIVGVKK